RELLRAARRSGGGSVERGLGQSGARNCRAGQATASLAPAVLAVKRGAIHCVSLDRRRPAVIVSPDVRNRLANDLIIVPCSTSARAMAWHVQLRRGEAGLSQACMAKCEQIATVPKSW